MPRVTSAPEKQPVVTGPTLDQRVDAISADIQVLLEKRSTPAISHEANPAPVVEDKPIQLDLSDLAMAAPTLADLLPDPMEVLQNQREQALMQAIADGSLEPTPHSMPKPTRDGYPAPELEPDPEPVDDEQEFEKITSIREYGDAMVIVATNTGRLVPLHSAEDFVPLPIRKPPRPRPLSEKTLSEMAGGRKRLDHYQSIEATRQEALKRYRAEEEKSKGKIWGQSGVARDQPNLRANNRTKQVAVAAMR